MKQNVFGALGWLLSLLLVSGCSQNKIENEIASYAAQCRDAGTSNVGVNTKLTGQNFHLEVALLDSNGALVNITNDQLRYVQTVNTDFTESGTQAACESGASAITDLRVGGVAATAVNLAKTTNSRQTVFNLSLAQPHLKLFCRVNVLTTDGTWYRKCAPATFATRPASFVFEVVEPIAPRKINGQLLVAAGEGGASTHSKSSFTLKAKAVNANNTTLTGFSGHSTSLNLTTTAGLNKLLVFNKVGSDATASALAVKGILSPATFTFANGEATARLSYSEVGFIRMDQDAMTHASLTTEDANNGRCVANSTSNVVNAQGRIGCLIGSQLFNVPIKYVPFQLKADNIVTKTVDNAANSCARFAYFGGEVTSQFRLRAMNSVGNVTRNYHRAAGLAVFNPSEFAQYQVANTSVTNHLNQPVSIAFNAANASNPITATDWVDGATTVSIKFRSDRPLQPLVPTLIEIKAKPADVEMDSTGLVAERITTPLEFRYGRLKLWNAYGAETLPLHYEVDAQFYRNNSWVLNSDDACSTLQATMLKIETPTDNARNRLPLCGSTVAAQNNGVFAGGHAKFNFSAPGHGAHGWMYLSVKQDGINRDTDAACVTGLGRVKADTVNATPQFGAVNSDKVLISFGQYKSKAIYTGEQ